MNSSSHRNVVMDSYHLTLQDVAEVARKGRGIEIAPEALERIRTASDLIQSWIERGQVIYGVTTGFGALATVNIDAAQTRRLQENLLRSHSAGVGEPLPVPVVRAVMLLRVNGLTRGHSGITVETLMQLVNFLNLDIVPLVPSQGSVGASGDLCPLSHIALALVGEGDVFYRGRRTTARDAMKQEHLEPVALQPKEAIALINGTAAITGLGALALWDALSLGKLADIVGALSVEALHGVPYAFDERTHALRAHRGQGDVARNLRRLLEGSEIVEKHRNDRVQDAYSLRCIPQVHGASRNALRFIREALETEMNSVTDNPLIFPDTEDVLSGGNFHGQPVALPMDFFGIAVAEWGSISERRTARMVDRNLSNGLPPFLIADSGLNSGFMIPQYAQAAVVSENKTLAHPASVDSIPTSANQEDHVSMGYWASLKAARILENVQKVLGIELLCACQGLDFSAPLKAGQGTATAHKAFRSCVPHLDQDRFLHPLVGEAIRMVQDDTILQAVEEVTGPLD